MKTLLLILGCSLFFAGYSFEAQAQELLYPDYCTTESHRKFTSTGCQQYRLQQTLVTSGLTTECNRSMQTNCPAHDSTHIIMKIWTEALFRLSQAENIISESLELFEDDFVDDSDTDTGTPSDS